MRTVNMEDLFKDDFIETMTEEAEKSWELNGEKYISRVWDFMGEEMYRIAQDEK